MIAERQQLLFVVVSPRLNHDIRRIALDEIEARGSDGPAMESALWSRVVHRLGLQMNAQGWAHEKLPLDSAESDFELRGSDVRVLCLGPIYSSGPSFVRMEYGKLDAPALRWGVGYFPPPPMTVHETPLPATLYQVLAGPQRLVVGGGVTTNPLLENFAPRTYENLFQVFVELLNHLEEQETASWDVTTPGKLPLDTPLSPNFMLRPRSKSMTLMGSGLIGTTVLGGAVLATALAAPPLLAAMAAAPGIAGGLAALHFAQRDVPKASRRIRKKILSSALFDVVEPTRAMTSVQGILLGDTGPLRSSTTGIFRSARFEASTPEIALTTTASAFDTKSGVFEECRIVPSTWAGFELRAQQDILDRVPELPREERGVGYLRFLLDEDDIDSGQHLVELLTSLQIASASESSGPYR